MFWNTLKPWSRSQLAGCDATMVMPGDLGDGVAEAAQPRIAGLVTGNAFENADPRLAAGDLDDVLAGELAAFVVVGADERLRPARRRRRRPWRRARVSTMTIGTLASFALTSAETISREPLGVIASTLMPVCIRFSTICICLSTSISRSAACTCSVTPRRSAASCAPRRMSTKNGWFSVLSTSATVGLSSAAGASRLQDTGAASARARRRAR